MRRHCLPIVVNGPTALHERQQPALLPVRNRPHRHPQPPGQLLLRDKSVTSTVWDLSCSLRRGYFLPMEGRAMRVPSVCLFSRTRRGRIRSAHPSVRHIQLFISLHTHLRLSIFSFSVTRPDVAHAHASSIHPVFSSLPSRTLHFPFRSLPFLFVPFRSSTFLKKFPKKLLTTFSIPCR